MKSILIDIKEQLRSGVFKNEEHVRFSLVGRIVQGIGWNIWNPMEVNTEFNSVPNEDKTRVDMALFLPPWNMPSVFIEIKSVGKMLSNLSDIEKQTRDYNRNNTAPISIITDGRNWKFYLSQTAGEFSQKCFETFDLLDESKTIDDLESALQAFLSREQIANENAVHQALSYLKRTQKEKAMYEMLPTAKKDAEIDPSKSWAENFVIRLKRVGIEISIEDAIEFIKKHGALPIISSSESKSVPQEYPHIEIAAIPTSPRASGKLHLIGRSCDAYGYVIAGNRFVVERGSKAVKNHSPRLQEKNIEIRADLIAKGIFTSVNDSFVLTQDYTFNSSSQAASIFLGCSASGPREWRAI